MVKGRAAVDASCPRADECHVYEERDDVYDALLNQTNIANNNNKVTGCHCHHRLLLHSPLTTHHSPLTSLVLHHPAARDGRRLAQVLRLAALGARRRGARRAEPVHRADGPAEREEGV